jgi:hypothetical protein
LGQTITIRFLEDRDPTLRRPQLKKFESRGLIELPPLIRSGPKRLSSIEPVDIDQTAIIGRLPDIQPVKVIDARASIESEKAFNYRMKAFHYLSFGRTVRQNMKYLIVGDNERILGCLLFGAAAWKAEDRDRWIGWSPSVRERNLGLICNNTRFLILPQIRVPHMASHALGACLRRLPMDWQRRYGTTIALVETFVDTSRFIGTCYRAANWRRVGKTKGRTRQDRYLTITVPVKDIWVNP